MVNKLTKYQEEVLFGHLLGDGGLELHKNGRHACFRLLRILTDKDYLMWSSKIFEKYLTSSGVTEGAYFDKRTNKTYYNIRFRTGVNPIFTEYHKKWYKNGIKIIPKNLKLTLNMVKVWFADDGCVRPPKDKLNQTSFYIKIATHCFTKKEVRYLKKQLDILFGVNFYINKMGKVNQYCLYLHEKHDCRRFLRFLDKEFPLKRKSNIWNNPNFKLWEEIKKFPNCKYCKSKYTFRNGHGYKNKQTYMCKDCNRQFT